MIVVGCIVFDVELEEVECVVETCDPICCSSAGVASLVLASAVATVAEPP